MDRFSANKNVFFGLPTAHSICWWVANNQLLTGRVECYKYDSALATWKDLTRRPLAAEAAKVCTLRLPKLPKLWKYECWSMNVHTLAFMLWQLAAVWTGMPTNMYFSTLPFLPSADRPLNCLLLEPGLSQSYFTEDTTTGVYLNFYWNRRRIKNLSTWVTLFFLFWCKIILQWNQSLVI